MGEIEEGKKETAEQFTEIREKLANIKDVTGWFRGTLQPAYDEMYKETHKPLNLKDIFGWESIAKMGMLGIVAVVALLFVMVIVLAVV